MSWLHSLSFNFFPCCYFFVVVLVFVVVALAFMIVCSVEMNFYYFFERSPCKDLIIPQALLLTEYMGVPTQHLNMYGW